MHDRSPRPEVIHLLKMIQGKCYRESSVGELETNLLSQGKPGEKSANYEVKDGEEILAW